MTTPGIVSTSRGAAGHGHRYSVASAYEKAVRQSHDHADSHTDNATADRGEELRCAVWHNHQVRELEEAQDNATIPGTEEGKKETEGTKGTLTS